MEKESLHEVQKRVHTLVVEKTTHCVYSAFHPSRFLTIKHAAHVPALEKDDVLIMCLQQMAWLDLCQLVKKKNTKQNKQKQKKQPASS